MMGLIRRSGPLVAFGLLAVSSTAAGGSCPAPGLGVPCAGMSSIEGRQAVGQNTFVYEQPSHGIRLVGEAPYNPPVSADGAVDNPDPLGRIVVHVRDFLGGAIPGSHVVLDFNYPGSPCSDTRLCLTPVAGQTLTCSGGSQQIEAITDAHGDAVFWTIGASYNTGSPSSNIGPSAPAACCKVLANGDELATLKVAIFDQDGVAGVNGVNGVDVNIVSKANIYNLGQGGTAYLPRHDVNLDGAVDGRDSNFEAVRNLEASPGQRRGSYSGCPAGPAGYCPM